MKITTLENIEQIHVFLNKFRKNNYYKFRGQSDSDWQLIPKAGRLGFNKSNDEKIFTQWKRRAVSYLEKENFTEWDLLAIAQHTGLPTRLLDWTHTPLVALFFACIEKFDKDGALYTINKTQFVKCEKFGPFEHDFKMGLFQPSTVSNRLANQFGYFTVHFDPTLPIDEKTFGGYIEKLIIPYKLKNDLLHLLNQYGVNYLSLFPDLEGLSKHLIWFMENNEYWKINIDNDEII